MQQGGPRFTSKAIPALASSQKKHALYSLLSTPKRLRRTVLMPMLPQHFQQLPWHQSVRDWLLQSCPGTRPWKPSGTLPGFLLWLPRKLALEYSALSIAGHRGWASDRTLSWPLPSPSCHSPGSWPKQQARLSANLRIGHRGCTRIGITELWISAAVSVVLYGLH